MMSNRDTHSPLPNTQHLTPTPYYLLSLHYLIIGDGAEEFAAVEGQSPGELDFVHETFAEPLDRKREGLAVGAQSPG